MAGRSYDHLLKLLLIGDMGVGKTSLLERFADDEFDEHQPATIGVDFKLVTMKIGGKRCRINAWDTAGSERFRSLSANFYRGAKGVLIVYDITRAETKEHLDDWLREVEEYCPGGARGVAKLLVGNKKDLAAERRAVSREEGEAWARANGALFVETSAKANEGVRQAFEELVEQILDNPALLEGTAPAIAGGSAGGVALGGGGGEREEEAGIGCC